MRTWGVNYHTLIFSHLELPIITKPPWAVEFYYSNWLGISISQTRKRFSSSTTWHQSDESGTLVCLFQKAWTKFISFQSNYGNFPIWDIHCNKSSYRTKIITSLKVPVCLFLKGHTTMSSKSKQSLECNVATSINSIEYYCIFCLPNQGVWFISLPFSRKREEINHIAWQVFMTNRCSW